LICIIGCAKTGKRCRAIYVKLDVILQMNWSRTGASWMRLCLLYPLQLLIDLLGGLGSAGSAG
jgi:hypothetical protein